MAFITIEDYRTLIADSDLEYVTKADKETREKAEKLAQSEISKYLRPRYSLTTIFNAVGEARNESIIMYMIDVALFHLFSKLPGRMGMEMRQLRYDNTIKALQEIATGKTDLALPLIDSSDSENSIRWGSNGKKSNDW